MLLDLIQNEVSLRGRGTELYGPCPGCGGTDRFRVWPETGRYWCRQCNRSGDAIQFLRDFRGFSFQDAAQMVGKALPACQSTDTDRKQQAREAVLHRFYAWKHDHLRQLTNIIEQLDIAETAYRSICRAPHVWPEDEQRYWIARLGQLYLDYDLTVYESDVIVNDPRAAWDWWREEQQ